MLNKLRYWLKPIDIIFDDFRDYVLDTDDNKRHRIFIDRESDVLFVAHLDTVIKPKFIRKTNKRIYATGLDDRLGCLAACELSQQFNTDLLLTDHEESFESTAQYHDHKGYKWIVEFDRYRDDVVVYDCGSKEFENAISEYWKIGLGSFSDICMMDVECCCMNLGIGYYDAHSEDSYVVIKQFHRQVEKFRLFYEKYRDKQFLRDIPYWETVIDDYKDDGLCEMCSFNYGKKVYDLTICEDCFSTMVMQYLYKNEKVV